MKKIIISFLVVGFVFSLACIAGAQSSSSDQSGAQKYYGEPRSGGSGESGGPPGNPSGSTPPEMDQSGQSQSGTNQQYGTGQSGTSQGGGTPQGQYGTSPQYPGKESEK